MGEEAKKRMTVIDEFACLVDQEQKRARISKMIPLIVLIILLIFFAIFRPAFLSYNNILALLNQASIPLVLACGATFVILIGSIDLSLEGVMAMTGTILSCLVYNNTTNLRLGIGAVLLVILMGAGMGAFIGLLQVKCKVPSFLLTYGISSVCTGITLLVYKAIPVTILDKGILGVAQKTFLGLPVLSWLALAVFLACLFMQEFTPIGRYIYAVGTDENVPKGAGININKVKIFVFAFSGLCIAIGGIMGAARLGRGDLQIANNRLFPTITAVVLGGTSLAGGKGGVGNTLIGCLIITVLNNGMIFMGVPSNVVEGIEGIIIILAVAFSMTRSRKSVVK